MKATITGLIILLAAWVIGGTWYWVCQVKGHCIATEVVNEMVSEAKQDMALTADTDGDAEDALTAKDLKSRPFLVNYQNDAIIQYADNLRFGKGSAIPFVPVGVKARLDSLAMYLDENPDRDLEVTGQFAEDEPQPTSHLNLGLARADNISDYMVAQGVEKDRIIKSYARSDAADLFGNQDTMMGGIDFKLVNRADASRVSAESDAATETDTEEANEVLTFESRELYFETGSDYLSMDDELRSYITGVIQYLNQNKDKKLVLTGHTDNVGTRANNQSLGQERANTVQRYFREFGLDAVQISTTSQGESKPVASNRTEAGRQKNRRVEITIK